MLKTIKREFRYYTRHIRWFYQRLSRGWDERELWSLDITFAEYIVPRLKAFKEIHLSHVICPGSLEGSYKGNLGETTKEEEENLQEHWENILSIMIEGFEIIKNEEYYFVEDIPKVNNALCLFHKYYFALWD